MANNFEYPGGFKTLIPQPTDPRSKVPFIAVVQTDPTYYIGYPDIFDESDGKHYRIIGGSAGAWILEEHGSGSLTIETDPIFIASPANNITTQDIDNLSNLSGTNTGDQDLSGYSLTTHNHAGTYVELSSSEFIDLTDNGNSTLHYHATDRDRANHTGTQTATTVTLDTTNFTNNLDGTTTDVQKLADAVDDLVASAGPDVFASDIVVSLSGGKTIGKYTNGQTIPAAGKTAEEVMRLVSIEELFPTLVSPDNAFSLTQAGLREIGETVTLSFNATFNRGSITPPYTTSGFRSGLPTTYKYTGTGLPVSVATSVLSNPQSVVGYVVLPAVQSWTNIVTMLAGEQPVGSAGSNFSTPWPAGDTTAKTVSITGVYPWFATSVSLATQTKQPLALMNSVYVQVTMVAEDGVTKQRADFPTTWSAITGVQFFNTNNNSWEWINGSKVASLGVWDIDVDTKTVQGQSVDYLTYTHNDATTGSRQLRFYTN